jgi:putative transposase
VQEVLGHYMSTLAVRCGLNRGWGITICYTQLGNPQQYACIERHNRAVRYAWLANVLLDSIDRPRKPP